MSKNYVGTNAIREALLSLKSSSVATLYILKDSRGKNRELEEIAKKKNLKIEFPDRKTLEKLGANTKNCLLQIKVENKVDKNSNKNFRESSGNSRKVFKDAREFIKTIGDKKNVLVLVLDGVTDVGNLAAIVRSCDCFSVDLLVVGKNNSASFNDRVYSLSQGALEYVSTLESSNLVRDLEYFKEAGFWLYSLEMDGDNLFDCDFSNKSVLIAGSEGFGIRPLVAKTADFSVSIPMSGHIDSLNVSVASAIALAEYRRGKR